ncbi:MAG: hypothetical protein ABIC91_00050 [Nanoarchaeota archaeon]|nr:hypothetical protein [Nanoarchaeota archaeon]MBU1029604.1 hypothetical protein [Nanoarchaeota archaeon]MBU1850106.1 hypothetical protein [Nanoarchaeota archaeon]
MDVKNISLLFLCLKFCTAQTSAITQPEDVHRLNGLQVIFGLNNIYFRNYSQADLNQQFIDLHNKRDEKTIIESLGTKPKGDGYEELIHTAKDNAIYNLTNLSFLIINPNADNTPGIRD